MEQRDGMGQRGLCKGWPLFRGWLVIMQSAGTCSVPNAEAGCFV
ncbi:MAG: hypothetical protein U9Q68_07175 [Euryarchaeota archaeon]|nr:hypothetical protein [Euryarchaeota archaeon]